MRFEKGIMMKKDFRIKNMSCDGKPIPDKYIACFNGYIEDVINKSFEQLNAEINNKYPFIKETLIDDMSPRYFLVYEQYGAIISQECADKDSAEKALEIEFRKKRQ